MRLKRRLGRQAKANFPEIRTLPKFRAFFAINTENAPMPYRQILDVQCAFQNANISTSKYQTLTIPESHMHAFEYWRELDGHVPPHRIRDDVFAFFTAHFNDPPQFLASATSPKLRVCP